MADVTKDTTKKLEQWVGPATLAAVRAMYDEFGCRGWFCDFCSAFIAAAEQGKLFAHIEYAAEDFVLWAGDDLPTRRPELLQHDPFNRTYTGLRSWAQDKLT